MKKILLLFSLVICIFLGSNVSNASAFTYKSGDILVTKSTRSSGLTGHTGLVLTNTKNVLHIRGYNHTPVVISLSEWLEDYPSTKVVRYSNSSKAYDAAYWASKNYANNGPYSKLPYGFLDNIKSFDKTYCSKIVWQAYYYGAQKGYKVYVPSNTINGDKYEIPSIIEPYQFIKPIDQSYNGFSTVKSINW